MQEGHGSARFQVADSALNSALNSGLALGADSALNSALNSGLALGADSALRLVALQHRYQYRTGPEQALALTRALALALALALARAGVRCLAVKAPTGHPKRS